ncbi:MAG: hypothetical protein ABW051_04530, partial [Burkholderiaceae bacterium]
RAATALPALIGARTISLLEIAGAGALHARVKVPRPEVRGILLRMVLALAGRDSIAAQFERLRAKGRERPGAMGQSGT